MNAWQYVGLPRGFTLYTYLENLKLVWNFIFLVGSYENANRDYYPVYDTSCALCLFYIIGIGCRDLLYNIYN